MLIQDFISNVNIGTILFFFNYHRTDVLNLLVCSFCSLGLQGHLFASVSPISASVSYCRNVLDFNEIIIFLLSNALKYHFKHFCDDVYFNLNSCWKVGTVPCTGICISKIKYFFPYKDC
jgi:hypothetical protein